MIPNRSFAVANVQVSQLPIICKQIEGYFQGGANAWLQVHDSCITPAAAAVPKWQMLLNATAQFQETLQVDEMVLSEGLFVGVSSTDGTWTASASTMDVTVWTNDTPIATNVVGDKTTPTVSRQAWANSNAAKRLYALIVTELSGVTQYIYGNALSGVDNIYTSQAGFICILAPNATKVFHFGVEGLNPTFVDVHNILAGGVGQVYNGCSFFNNSTLIIDFSGTSQIFFNSGGATVAMLVITN